MFLRQLSSAARQMPKEMITEQDIIFLRHAMSLAERGAGSVNPNPLVGAVVVRDGDIIAEGWHRKYGGLHAEREAFAYADSHAIQCQGATMYVTLEPCCHHGHQPPCTEAVISHGISRVVVGMTDPNPLVAGKGIEILHKAGIAVEVAGEETPLARELRFQNRVFLKYITSQHPWITMKYAMTLDGKICTTTGESQWITGEEARRFVHILRKRHTAILCGIGTILADDPMLTTRIDDEPEARNPIRIILDRNLRTPLTAKVVTTAGKTPTVIVHAPDADTLKAERLHEAGVRTWSCHSLRDMAEKAHAEGIDSILVEGGGTINEAFVREGLADELWAFIAPKIVGGSEAKTPVEGQGIARLADAMTLDDIRTERFGNDVCIHGITKVE